MALRDEILAMFPNINAKTRYDADIAKKLSEGRTRLQVTAGGLPKIVEALGAAPAVEVLALLQKSAPENMDFWLLRAIENERTDFSSVGFQQMVDASENLSEVQRQALRNMVLVPAQITEHEVALALAGYFDDKPVPAEVAEEENIGG